MTTIDLRGRHVPLAVPSDSDCDWTFTVKDSAGDAVDLTGNTFTVEILGDTGGTVSATVDDADIATGVLVCGFDDDDLAAITSTSLTWKLRNTTDEKTWLTGPCVVTSSGQGAAASSSVAVTIDSTIVTITVGAVGTGPAGATGAAGADGADGADGLGVPAGGTTGQVLAKASNADNDTEWTAAGSGDVVGPGSATDSNFAAFDSTTGKLIKDSGSAASTFAAASHNHGASDITSGTLAVAQGGTNASTAGAARTSLGVAATVNTVGATGSTETLAFATDPASIVHDVTMDEDCTFSFSGAPSSGTTGTMTVIVRGAFTPTLPASVDWAGGSAPTYGSPSVYEFVTVDGGTTVLGFLAGSEFS